MYGSAHELEALFASFDRIVGSVTPEFVHISGYSGIGTSSVVYELHKMIVLSRGLFASGKFDQYMHDSRYAALAQAFQHLVRSILAKTEADPRTWRDNLVRRWIRMDSS